ncbi:MAG: cryptochrome/photolyase family protein [Phycisphaerae bacterium]
MCTMATSIIWFRHDLRLADNPALLAAVEQGGPVVPVYAWSPEDEGEWPPGAASRWWLHHALAALDADLRKLGSRLIIRSGRTVETLVALVLETKAAAVFWNHRYEPAAVQIAKDVESTLRRQGLAVGEFHGNLLFDPRVTLNRQGRPFQVFTPYWKHCLSRPEPELPKPAPGRIPRPRQWPPSLSLNDLRLLPKLKWAEGIAKTWVPGEQGASDRLDCFIKNALSDYTTSRDHPEKAGTSRLSPDLHWGHVSPRQVWHAVKRSPRRKSPKVAKQAASYLRQVGWREFAHHLLVHFPHTPQEPLRPVFASFPWNGSPEHLRAWQHGRTGYPLVDAGMRELWHTGWMHNRARMVVASFLVKHLLVPWQEGARWFWDTLVDADLANNTLGWQWCAGCGADAAPYFRIFNPVLQGRKFDPDGGYVRHWVPELAGLSNKRIHEPWSAKTADLAECCIRLGRDYPEPIVDHAQARKQALNAYEHLRGRLGR